MSKQTILDVVDPHLARAAGVQHQGRRRGRRGRHGVREQGCERCGVEEFCARECEEGVCGADVLILGVGLEVVVMFIGRGEV